jgi:hypothetical protein
VVSNYGDNTVSVLAGFGNEAFAPKVDYPTGEGPISVTVVNVSGDNNPDLAVVDKGTDTVRVLVGTGNGTFVAEADYPTGSGRLPSRLRI